MTKRDVLAIQQPDIHVVTVGAVGPRGAKGDSTTGTMPNGVTTGDFVRYNAVTGLWEVAAEPLALKGLVLTPALSSLVVAEGAVYYNSSSKSIQVCTDAV